MNRLLPIFLALLLPVSFSACPLLLVGGAAASAGMYVSGELRATRNTTLPDSAAATEQALADLGVTLVQKERDGLGALYVAKGVEEKTIKVRLKKIFDDVTEISIRVGFLGDEMQSRLILDRIETNLRGEMSGTGVRPSLP